MNVPLIICLALGCIIISVIISSVLYEKQLDKLKGRVRQLEDNALEANRGLIQLAQDTRKYIETNEARQRIVVPFKRKQ